MPSPDHHRIIDAGVGTRKRAGVGTGKRRWYATIFSVERPRSRSISTERRGRSVSRAGSAPRSWSPSCRPLDFTRATSVFTSAVCSHQCSAVYGNTHRPYGVPLKFDRNASTPLSVLAQSISRSAIRGR